MKSLPDSSSTLIKVPGAFLPMAMSMTALLLLGIVATTKGLVRESDDGLAAHLWQLLIAGQVPIVAYFLLRWLPRLPRATALVVALQITVALAGMAPVYVLGL